MEPTNPTYAEHLRVAMGRSQRPSGVLAGDNLATLEALAWRHLFGMDLALKKGRCTKALKNLCASVNAELSKGPLEAHGYAHKGYGAISNLFDSVRIDAGVYSRRSTPYLEVLREYSHGASFFWYQLQHLTDIPQYRDDAADKCEVLCAVLIEMEP